MRATREQLAMTKFEDMLPFIHYLPPIVPSSLRPLTLRQA